jgi:molybdopterin-synthase adenylyltransferase
VAEHILERFLQSKLLGTTHTQGWRVILVGVGGNGSKALIGLKNISLALEALGCHGFSVTVFDADVVSEANLVRQAFYPSDLGLNKAVTLVNRLNLSCGLRWTAVPEVFNAQHARDCDLLVTCVDSGEARAEISSVAHCARYWLDFGNASSFAQAILGQPRRVAQRALKGRLPTVAELLPRALETDAAEERLPSCSAVQALERQDLFIGDAVVTAGLNIIWRLVRHGVIAHHGVFVNLETGTMQPLPVDARAWRRLKAMR